MFTSISLCICLHIRIYMYIRSGAHLCNADIGHLCTYPHVYTCTCVFMYMCIHVHVYAGIDYFRVFKLYIYVCLHVCLRLEPWHDAIQLLGV